MSEQAFINAFSKLPKIGNWERGELLGQGGFGIVFKGSRLRVDATREFAAIKILTPGAQNSASRRELFIHEFNVLSSLDSKYIPSILDSGIEHLTVSGKAHDLQWFAMEYITGESLAKDVKNHGALDRNEWLECAHDLLSAIAVAHEANIIHQDIKPDNIMRFSRRSVLVDFGVASFVNVDDPGDSGLGTIGYCSPEQLNPHINNETLGFGVDLFAAGVTLTFAGTQHLPWAMPSRKDTPPNIKSDAQYTEFVAMFMLEKFTRTAPDLSGLDAEQTALVRQMLQLDPARRGSALELLTKVKELLPEASSRKTEELHVSAQQARGHGGAHRAGAGGGGQNNKGQAAANAAGRIADQVNQMQPGKERSYLVTWILAVLVGVYGVDRFYLGKIWTGLLKLFTAGGYGVWVLIDVILLLTGKTTDRWNRPLEDFDKYAGITRTWTIVLFAAGFGFFILLLVLSFIYGENNPTPPN